MMRLSFAGERVLAVVAHPDDVELLCAGTLARARDEGAAVGLCVICQGDKGQPEPPLDDLVGQRARELRKAARLLGAEVMPGWVPDSSLYDTDGNRRELVERIRTFRPTLILGHDPGDYHADHRGASQLTDVSSWLSTSRGFATERPVLERAPEVWWMDSVGMQGFVAGFAIDISEQMELKKQMLLCHRSQLQRSGDTTFAPLMDLMLQQAGTRGMQSGSRAAEVFRRHDVFKRTRAW
jgi:LmbE family N-acetylglucosaminyl deacetylase